MNIMVYKICVQYQVGSVTWESPFFCKEGKMQLRIPRGALAVQEPNLEPLLGLLQGWSPLWVYLSSFHLPIPNLLCLSIFFSSACLINIIF